MYEYFWMCHFILCYLLDQFSYNEDGISIYRNGEKISGANNASDTRKATIKLLRTIVVLTQTLKPLPGMYHNLLLLIMLA